MYAFIPLNDDIANFVRVPRLILVTQEELGQGMVGVYDGSGAYRTFSASSLAPLDASRENRELVDAAIRVRRARQPGVPYELSLSFDGTRALLRTGSSQVWDEFEYDVSGSPAVATPITQRQFSKQREAALRAPFNVLVIVGTFFCWVCGDRLLCKRLIQRST